MGKYMKKSKITNDIGVMEASEPTSLGVRTRAAKTLALKRLNSSASDSALAADSSCYLQLRSRRLEKPPLLAEPPKQLPRPHKSGIKESGSKSRVDSVNSDAPASGSVPVAPSCNGDDFFGKSASPEASCGENSLDFESRYSTRESTPCNFVEDLEIIVTPGSSTRSMRTTSKGYTRDRDSMVPTASEMEEFFAFAEQQQQRLFMEKYNFDIVNEMPLTGRFEWVQVTP
uniref:Cyclin-dependent kinase inhibitor 3 n=1 Tax=Noccaea caerulescens TaxID=107243 RepID=A0A1J3CC21_NOCCA